MAGNQEVTDLPVIPAVDGADVYGAKNNLDYRIRTGEAGGLATLDGTGKLPSTQLTTNIPQANVTNLTTDLASKVNKAGDTVTGILAFNNSVPGVQNVWNRFGWNNGAYRWAFVGEANADFGFYAYNAASGFLGRRFYISNASNAVGVNGALLVGESPNGQANVVAGNPGNPGFVEFRTPDGTRRGYVGFASGSNTTYSMENGWGLVFSGGAVTYNSGAPVTFNSTSRQNGLFQYFNGGIGTQTPWRAMGWNNGVVRWQEYIEPDASMTFYSYDSGGAFFGRGITWTQSGVVTSVNFVATSDERLKKDITDKVARRGLADKLRLVDFIWKNSGEKDQGLIAQEVEILAPEYIHKNYEGELAVDKVGLLLECVVDLAARVRELESK